MRLKLYIIRHGQPASQEPEYPGGNNPPLGKKGKIQAQRAAEQLVQWHGVDLIYSSTLARTLETTEPIYEKLQVPWHIWPALSECGRGSWPKWRTEEGKRAAEAARTVTPERAEVAAHDPYYPLLSRLKAKYPEAIFDQPFEAPEAWWIPFEGETRELTYARAEAVLAELKRRHFHEDKRLAVVCHGAFGSVLVNLLMDSPPGDHNRYHHAHAAITRVDIYEDETVSLRFLNYQGHLMPDLVTEGVHFP